MTPNCCAKTFVPRQPLRNQKPNRTVTGRHKQLMPPPFANDTPMAASGQVEGPGGDTCGTVTTAPVDNGLPGQDPFSYRWNVRLHQTPYPRRIRLRHQQIDKRLLHSTQATNRRNMHENERHRHMKVALSFVPPQAQFSAHCFTRADLFVLASSGALTSPE